MIIHEDETNRLQYSLDEVFSYALLERLFRVITKLELCSDASDKHPRKIPYVQSFIYEGKLKYDFLPEGKSSIIVLNSKEGEGLDEIAFKSSVTGDFYSIADTIDIHIEKNKDRILNNPLGYKEQDNFSGRHTDIIMARRAEYHIYSKLVGLYRKVITFYNTYRETKEAMAVIVMYYLGRGTRSSDMFIKGENWMLDTNMLSIEHDNEKDDYVFYETFTRGEHNYLNELGKLVWNGGLYYKYKDYVDLMKTLKGY